MENREHYAERKKERNIQIDLLRVAATVAVVRLHAGGSGIISDIFHYLCSFAVPVFFMISGYLLLSKDVVEWSYIGERVLKYIRLVICWSILLALAQSIIKRGFVNPFTILLQSILQHGLLWQGWYIWSLLVVTILTPFLHGLMHAPKWRRFTSIILGAVVVFVHILDLTVAVSRGFPVQKLVPQSLRIWTYLFYYWMGGLASAQQHTKDRRKSVLLLTVLVVPYQIIVCRNIFALHTQEYCYISPLFILWDTILFDVSLMLSIKSNKLVIIVQQMSKLTLGVYLIHPLINSILKELGYWTDSRWVIQFAISFFGSVLVVYVIKRLPYVNKLLC